jgi:hypothetical protein
LGCSSNKLGSKVTSLQSPCLEIGIETGPTWATP